MLMLTLGDDSWAMMVSLELIVAVPILCWAMMVSAEPILLLLTLELVMLSQVIRMLLLCDVLRAGSLLSLLMFSSTVGLEADFASPYCLHETAAQLSPLSSFWIYNRVMMMCWAQIEPSFILFALQKKMMFSFLIFAKFEVLLICN